MTREKELIVMLKTLKEQAQKSCRDTIILDVKIDSFIFVIDEAISALEQEPVLDKIRAEIAYHKRKTYTIDPYDLVGDCLDIIDKYRAES